ncbi:MAG: bifunctional phosphoribosylaminoimidazolecarboxamide formyltransferase/IMP cyclohydrolase [Candidatus Eiseniibacteriota bacterium]|nr:MAG: bifunctional phosphoribosylaminoimidazolecarboxamide formyltransferase/IMP cyclohydrolase [Candidatus Eisenbacteria bacterium]
MQEKAEGNAGRIRVRTAFISVHDKSGLLDFARFLSGRGVELYATGGTASFLREASVPVRKAEELTGFSELLSGKVKSLSPRLHACVLFDRSDSNETAQVEKEGTPPIDMVVVNFYPFQKVQEKTELGEALSLIDIGGPASLRAAAKNFRWVVPVPEPAAYEKVMDDMAPGEPSVSRALSLQLAARVYETTSSYDAMVRDYFSRQLKSESAGGALLPERLCLGLDRLWELRYGENPHQAASFYVSASGSGQGAPAGRQLQGKQLSFNNLLDLDAAVSACREFEPPACVIVKHRTPCGAALAADLHDAYRLARDCDPLSAFGGVIAVNRPVTGSAAEDMSELFLEMVAAPAFQQEALHVLSKKKNLRVMELPPECFARGSSPRLVIRSGPGGLLFQEEDTKAESVQEWTCVSERRPSQEELEGLFFLWKVVRHVVSNAIVIGKGDRTLGIGSGQTSRVDAVETALLKARRAGHDVRGAWLASDAFFPFRDSIDVAAATGITAVVEPGGSRRDEECVQAADERGLVLCFTGRRCFKH